MVEAKALSGAGVRTDADYAQSAALSTKSALANLDAEMTMQKPRLGAHRLGRHQFDDMAVIDDVNAIGERHRGRDILLHDHDSLPGIRKLAARRQKIAHDDGGETFERLVEQQDLRLANQRARNRQHLLFAAGEIGAAAAAPFLEPRKHGVDAFKRPPLRRRQAGEDDVFFDVQAAKDAAVFVDQLHAGLGDDVAFLAGDLVAIEDDGPGARRHDAHQALQGRALAGPVAAQQRHDLVLLHAHRDVEQDMGIAVIAVQSADVEETHGACTPPR